MVCWLRCKSRLRAYNANCAKVAACLQAIVEIASYLGIDVIETYLQDPDVKFILTERDPDKWIQSMNSSIGELIKDVDTFPLAVLKRFEYWANRFFYLNQLMYWVFSNGKSPEDKNSHADMRQNYIQ